MKYFTINNITYKFVSFHGLDHVTGAKGGKFYVFNKEEIQ